MGGPGETQIETDRRLLADKVAKLKKELEEVRRTRQLHRAQRKKTPYPTIALVGYTNAGKSTLFNRLTDSKVEARDMLFATLDPTLREIKLPGGRPAILSDTVGFISDLPHELVEAFRATLEEVQEADIVLHVRDIAALDTEAEKRDVELVLDQLGCGRDSGRTIIEVWNKIDLLADEDRGVVQARALRSEGGSIALSAQTGEGIEPLLTLLGGLVDEGPPLKFTLAPGDGEALAWLYRNGRVVERTDSEEGVEVAVRLDRQAIGRFEQQFLGRTSDDQTDW
jgi:GTP-binding protein HflX